MPEYAASTYGDRIAARYDELYRSKGDESVTVGTLARLAGAGRALELGIGTGRIALPLAARGTEVHGMDSSEAMAAQLRAKPGGGSIPVTIGDFADFSLGQSYDLVFVIANTFFMLLSQEDQVRCFGAAARHLTDRGVFIIEAFVPDPARLVRDYVEGGMRAGGLRLDVSEPDVAEQRIRSSQVLLNASGIELFPVQLRYAWPAELDLMARLAGLRLRDRWEDWAGNAFTSKSTKHVSVYEKQPAEGDGGR